jgi:hypothetical protein
VRYFLLKIAKDKIIKAYIGVDTLLRIVKNRREI